MLTLFMLRLPQFQKIINPKLLFNLFAIIILVGSLKTVFAQTTPTNPLIDHQKALRDGSNQEFWLDNAIFSNIASSVWTLSGEIPESVLLGQADPKHPFIPGGTIGTTNKLIASTFVPPASGIEYIAHLKDNFLNKPAYAQDKGIGYSGLSPLLGIWRVFRNTVYIFSSIFFVILGLFIIFRVKINPQTVVTIQNAVPQIIISLILVTFSYAIAGLIIDLSYFIQALFVSVIYQAVEKPEVFLNPNNINLNNSIDPGFFGYYSMIEKIVPHLVIFSIGGVIGSIIGAILGAVTIPVPVIGSAIGALIGGGSGGALFILIVQIIIFISLVRFFFGLIKNYLTVILKIILAPLEIGLGALPNSKLSFSSWIYDLVAHLAVFPLSVLFIVLISVIINNITVTQDIWMPTLINLQMGFNVIPAIIGLAAVLLLPKLPDLIPQTIFQIKPSPWGTAIGEGLRPITATARTAAWTGAQYASDAQQDAYDIKKGGGGATMRTRDEAANILGNAIGFISGGRLRRRPPTP